MPNSACCLGQQLVHFLGDFIDMGFQRVTCLLTDTWKSDADVLNWLKAAGMAAGKDRAAPGLLEAGRALREVVRTLVLDKKAGKPLRVNGFQPGAQVRRQRLRAVVRG